MLLGRWLYAGVPHRGTSGHPARPTSVRTPSAFRTAEPSWRLPSAAVNKTRVEAVSDGIFAIAITLLVLTISEPDDYSDLGHQLADRWPALAAYAVSFAVIGIMWFNHHAIFGLLETIDAAFFYLNLLLLMTIAFLPYPTGVLGKALQHGEGQRTAAVVYSVTMTVNAITWGALWLYASTHRRLLKESFPEQRRRVATIAFTFGVFAYAIAVGVALINAYACLVFHGALAIYYALDPLSRRANRQIAAAEE
jgi:uncharacterized membrane protein